MPLKHEKPTDDLMREFEAVARRARGLKLALAANTNAPLDTLPLLQLDEILSVLASLPSGTAEGGRLQLEIADGRLNEIRIEFFSLKEGDGQSAGFMREVPLDDALSLLIAATRTALSAANRQAGKRDNAPHELSAFHATAADDEINGASSDGSKAIDALANAQRAGESILAPGSQRGDLLLRRLNDARGLARQARAELNWGDVFTAWVRKLSRALSRMPEVIRSAADMIDATADVVGPFYDQWKTLNDDIEGIVRKNIPDFSVNLRRAADRLEGRPGSERILYAEDEESVRVFTARALRTNGWTVKEARSGADALDIARRWRFDLLITDVVMPDIDGIELSKQIKKMYPSIPILVVSGYDQKTFRKAARGIPHQFLAKPYSLDQIHSGVRNLLAERQNMKAKNKS